MKSPADIKTVACIREVSEDVATAEAAALFPFTKDEWTERRNGMMEYFVKDNAKLVALFLRGEVPRAQVIAGIKRETDRLIEWDQEELWKKTMNAVYDNTRHKWIAYAACQEDAS